MVGEDPLCEKFPALYALANSKGARVQEIWERLGEAGCWNPRFMRPFNDNELEMVEEFIAAVQDRKISPVEKDKLIWKRAKNDMFFLLNPVLIFWKGGGQFLSQRGWFGTSVFEQR